MEDKLVALGIETMKLALYLSLPTLLAGLIAGLAISIFQATTQINESTLSFIPKIILTVIVMILTMPWRMSSISEFTIRLFRMIPTFPF